MIRFCFVYLKIYLIHYNVRVYKIFVKEKEKCLLMHKTQYLKFIKKKKTFIIFLKTIY